MPKGSSAVAAAWRPPEDISPADWAERAVRLPPGVSSRPGPLRFRGGLEFWRGILGWTTDRTVRRVLVAAAAQTGKSLALQVAAYDALRRDPGPVGYYLPTDEDARSYTRDRWRPVLRASPELRRVLSEARDADRLDGLRAANGGWLVALGAAAPQALKGRPMRVVLLDEVDEICRQHQDLGDPIERAANRAATYPDRSLVMAVSTPTADSFGIWPHFVEAQQWEFCIRCDGCAHAWAPEMPHIHWLRGAEGVRVGDPWLGCPECGHKHYQIDRPRQVGAGEWRCLHPDRPGDVRGARLWRWHSPWTSYAEIADAMWRAQGSAARTIAWRNEWLALPAKTTAIARVTREMVRRPDTSDRTHMMARPASEVIPADVLRVVVGADVQGACCWAVWLGVMAGGAYRMLWAGQFRGTQGVRSADLAALAEAARAEWSRADGAKIPTMRGAIDMGHRPHEVAQMLARDPRWVGVRGATAAKDGIATMGRAGVSGIATVWVQTKTVKDELARLIADQRFLFPTAMDESIRRHWTSEEKRLVRAGGRGVAKEAWVPVSPGAPNHCWDASVYALAIVHILGLGDLAPEVPADRSKSGRPVSADFVVDPSLL